MQQLTDKKSVLIVEDDADLRWTMAETLKDHAFVRESGNPLNALEILKKESIDLITTDIRMPDMSGVEFIKKVRATGLKIPIFVVSSSITIDLVVELQNCEVAWFFEKPFDTQQFRSTVRLFLGEDVPTREVIKTNRAPYTRRRRY